MNLIFRKAKIDELDHALELFKLASLSLGKKNVSQWAYWTDPPEEKITWVKEGFEKLGKPCAVEYKYDGFR